MTPSALQETGLARNEWLRTVVDYLRRELEQLAAVRRFIERSLAGGLQPREHQALQQQAADLLAEQQALLQRRRQTLLRLQAASGHAVRRLTELPWTADEQLELADLRRRLKAAAAQLTGIVRAGRDLLEQRGRLCAALLNLAAGASPYATRYDAAGERAPGQGSY